MMFAVGNHWLVPDEERFKRYTTKDKAAEDSVAAMRTRARLLRNRHYARRRPSNLYRWDASDRTRWKEWRIGWLDALDAVEYADDLLLLKEIRCHANARRQRANGPAQPSAQPTGRIVPSNSQRCGAPARTGD